MSEKSHIEWTDATWNPVLGCSKISPGCKNCYAIRTAWRLQHNPNPTVKAAFEGLTILQGGEPNWTGKVRLVEERLQEPLKWRASRRIFVNSQSDLFHEELSDEQIDRVVAVMAIAGQHTFQVLTKRPERMLNYMQRLALSIKPLEVIARNMGYTFKWTSPLDGKEYGLLPWPIPHVWWGTSVESPKYKDRIDHLRETPAAVRFLSLEPLLEDLGTLNLTGIHWVIVGAESGPGARFLDINWVRNIVKQCKAQKVPVFVKQLGPRPQEVAYPQYVSDKEALEWQRTGWTRIWDKDGEQWRKYYRLKDNKGGNPEEWPPDLRIRAYPRLQESTP